MCFSVAEISQLTKIPKHIAIIMDGNRRWAYQKNFPVILGHWRGVQSLLDLVEASLKLGVQVLTLYAFSTENWKRAEWEVSSLMRLFAAHMEEHRQLFLDHGVALRVIGNREGLPHYLQEKIVKLEELTASGRRMHLVLGINYGGRDEIVRAVKKLVHQVESGKACCEGISEESISRLLDTAAFSDPDLLIRTGGEYRLSNFLLWQSHYAELVMMEKFWPDFTPYDLLEAVRIFEKRNQRRGG